MSLLHPNSLVLAHLASPVWKLSPASALGCLILLGDGFRDELLYKFISISLWMYLIQKDRGCSGFQFQKLFFYHPYLFYHILDVEFQFETTSIFMKFHLLGKFG